MSPQAGLQTWNIDQRKQEPLYGERLVGRMGLFYLIFMTLLAALFFGLGWAVWKKGKITLIHSYHYTKVREEDKKAYTGQMGKALTVMGAGILLAGIALFVSGGKHGWGVCLLLFLAGLAQIVRAQIRYNRGIF